MTNPTDNDNGPYHTTDIAPTMVVGDELLVGNSSSSSPDRHHRLYNDDDDDDSRNKNEAPSQQWDAAWDVFQVSSLNDDDDGDSHHQDRRTTCDIDGNKNPAEHQKDCSDDLFGNAYFHSTFSPPSNETIDDKEYRETQRSVAETSQETHDNLFGDASTSSHDTQGVLVVLP